MADIAQLVRALVCGTKCRRFESGYPPHHKKAPQRGVFYGVRAVRARTAGSERQLARMGCKTMRKELNIIDVLQVKNLKLVNKR